MYTYIDSLYLSISTTKKNLPNELEHEAAAGGAPRAHRLRLHALAQTESNNAMQNGRGKGHFASRTVAAEAKQNIRSPTAVMQTMQAKKKSNPSPGRRHTFPSLPSISIYHRAAPSPSSPAGPPSPSPVSAEDVALARQAAAAAEDPPSRDPDVIWRRGKVDELMGARTVAPGCQGKKVNDGRSSRRRASRSARDRPTWPAAAPRRGLNEPSRLRSVISWGVAASFPPAAAGGGQGRGAPPSPVRATAPHLPRQMPSRREAMQFCFSSLLGRQFSFTVALTVGGCAGRA
jgi:hypothetical protein